MDESSFTIVLLYQSKGLQKLRWYCELCKKQCRDANGMKCHMQSESHLRNMKLFGQNSGKIIAQNSNAVCFVAKYHYSSNMDL